MKSLYVLEPDRMDGDAVDYRSVVARECFDGEIGFLKETGRPKLVLTKGAETPVSILALSASLDTCMRRTLSHVRAAKEQVYLVWLVRRGALRMSHADGCYVSAEGRIAVFDSSLPFFSEALVNAEGQHDSLFAIVPADLFRTYLPDARGLAGRPLGGDVPDGRLLRQVLALLYEEGDRLDRGAGQELLAVALKALRRMTEEQGTCPARRSSVREERLRALEAHIDLHLTNPRLSPQTAAAALGVTPRYLGYLLKDTGVSFSRLVQRKRQELVGVWLRSPATRRPICEIAVMAGYRSLAQFGRAFRSHHGCAPTEFRRRSIGRDAPPPLQAHLGRPQPISVPSRT
jgi:AraC-like DNA-binding protein